MNAKLFSIVAAVVTCTAISNAWGQDVSPTFQPESAKVSAESAQDGQYSLQPVASRLADGPSQDIQYSLPPTAPQPTVMPSCCTPMQADWRGFYVGLDGGYGLSSFNPVVSPFGATATSDFSTFSLKHLSSGPLFGAHTGYNWQTEDLVYGLEGDFNGSGISGSREKIIPSKLNPGGATNGAMSTDSIDWLASIRGRVGISRGLGLFYLTGGVAIEGLSQNAFINAETAPAVFGVSSVSSFSSVKAGYVVGTGYERIIARHWTVRAECLFYDFPQTDTNNLPFRLSSVPGSAAIIKTHENNISMLRVGVTYKF